MSTVLASRRALLQGSAAAMAAGCTVALTALYARQTSAQSARAQLAPVPSPYGPIAPVNDLSTGLPLLQLPAGFRYQSFGWTGDTMSDGQPCPSNHDGMAVVAPQRLLFGRGGGQNRPLVLVRNHERGLGSLIAAPGTYDTGTITVGTQSGFAAGGTTNLVYRNGAWESMAGSLGGTVANCAGGVTPWGTWLSCEEVRSDLSSSTGRRHGYVFEVGADPERTSGRPIIDMGRFSHEAVAVDPRTGYIYLTEDDRNKSGLYRFIPNDRSGQAGSLERGGRLQAARAKGRPNADLIVASVGDEYELEWVDIANPDANGVAGSGIPDLAANDVVSGPFAQAWAAGALRMSRGEGIWYAGGRLFIVDTSTGLDAQNRRGRGEGAVWVLDLASDRLRALFVSGNQLAANNPDNVTVSPRGGVLLCEDGGAGVDPFGAGSRLLGLTAAGESYYFAKNNVQLDAASIANAGKKVPPGDYRGGEFCGACWEPSGRTLFVNIQSPGITFAITGPWWAGDL